jgi:hypothetical protein
MDTFTKILIAAVVISLGLYYYKQYKNWKDEEAKLTWPINTPQCPDYWISTGGNKCKNMFNIGHCPKGKNGLSIPQGEVDFSSKIYQGQDGNYNKCRWAKRCSNSWEGIDRMCA